MSKYLIAITFDGGSSTNYPGCESASVIDFYDCSKNQPRRKLVTKLHPEPGIHRTAQYAEVMGVLSALTVVSDTIDYFVENMIPVDLLLRGDSQYVLDGCGKYRQKWINEVYHKKKYQGEWRAIHAILGMFQRVGIFPVNGKGADMLHDFCHECIQEVRIKRDPTLCELQIHHAPPLMRNDRGSEIWYR